VPVAYVSVYWHAGLGHGGAGASPAKINTRGLTFLDRWTDEANLLERADSLSGRRVGAGWAALPQPYLQRQGGQWLRPGRPS
jgi:hypothetical protein